MSQSNFFFISAILSSISERSDISRTAARMIHSDAIISGFFHESKYIRESAPRMK